MVGASTRHSPLAIHLTSKRGSLAAFALLTAVCLSGAAAADGRHGLQPLDVNAPAWQDGAPAIAGRMASSVAADVWRSGSDLVAEAARYVGSGKFTSLPGAWCADAVSAWLRATGRPPLASRMAASALRYGPHVAAPRPGDLVVMRTRRGPGGHVGIVERVNADDSIEIVSGNWSRRVARAVISRWQVTAFVAVR